MHTMKIYTTYFANLRHLPASVTPICIALYPPKGTVIAKYPALAPTPDILREYKASACMDEKDRQARYIKRYYQEVLSRLSPRQVIADLKQLSQNQDIALVCFEKSQDFCHRHLAISWLAPYLSEAGIENGFEFKRR